MNLLRKTGAAAWIDPVASVSATSCPVLVVQGETDLQVKPADARLLAAARSPGLELLLLDGANHLFKPVSGDLAAQIPSYGRPDPAVDARLIGAVARFAAAPPAAAP
jgi:fermentation-respiration switch protein FrsA (DUF1100 family)